jgi:hypothetical protein
MKTHFQSRGGVCGLLVASLLFAGGCNSGGLTIDETSAMEALTKFLDTWQNGGAIESLQSENPSIVGSDFNWKEGATLESYTVVKEVYNDGTNLDVLVELNLKAADGAASTVQALYKVGTEPVITVFRSDEEYLES